MGATRCEGGTYQFGEGSVFLGTWEFLRWEGDADVFRVGDAEWSFTPLLEGGYHVRTPTGDLILGEA